MHVLLQCHALYDIMQHLSPLQLAVDNMDTHMMISPPCLIYSVVANGVEAFRNQFQHHSNAQRIVQLAKEITS